MKARTLDRDFYGMCNIGHRPTVCAGNARTIETNIFGFDEDIYGLDLDITFISKIRNEIRFDSMESLRKQLESDRDACLTILK